MLEKNIILFILISFFSSISIYYVFSFNFLECLFFCFISLFIPLIILSILLNKNGIVIEFGVWNYGILISFLLSILKLPVFPFLCVENIYYKKFKRIKKPEVSEIRSYFVIFAFFILLISFFGFSFNFRLSLISSLFLFSFLLPYKNSIGSKIFYFDALIYGLFFIFSIFLLFLSIFLISI
jgi:hypothetical protein